MYSPVRKLLRVSGFNPLAQSAEVAAAGRLVRQQALAAAELEVALRHLGAASTHIDRRDDDGSAGHGSRVKWVNKSEWVTWVAGQYS